ncbi:DUF2510 domain-containing protein [Cryobacterium arcticum]|uniref:DUF2510 domain-containing protein n=1 Tax=Cryobacterium arcticum TaxID=670052 RepID=UPI0020070755|nr:DUF2510 domain-containing protein [Cryobacterium arcticum]
MSEPTTDAPAAGWYPDPSTDTQLRWYNGVEWTDEVAPVTPEEPVTDVAAVDVPDAYAPAAYAPTAYVAAASAPAASAPAAYAAAAGVPAMASDGSSRWGTVSVWLLAFMPWLSTISLIAAGMMSIYPANPDWWWVSALLLPWVLTVLLAVLDVQRLKQWLHTNVASWAWALLGAPVYLIARHVVLRPRARFGSAPMWVAIINIALAVVAAGLALLAAGALVVYVIAELDRSMRGIN